MTTYEANGLNCRKRLNQPDPVTLKIDNNGVTIGVSINSTNVVRPVTCPVNDTLILGCTVSYGRDARQVNITLFLHRGRKHPCKIHPYTAGRYRDEFCMDVRWNEFSRWLGWEWERVLPKPR